MSNDIFMALSPLSVTSYLNGFFVKKGFLYFMIKIRFYMLMSKKRLMDDIYGGNESKTALHSNLI